ncbi:MAG: hypothetical protein DMF87_18820 [Acidobacteria bacterium]|nr:MAG: hypothetical protein DMF87_18820 [Acidobacteriota bacterium]
MTNPARCSTIHHSDWLMMPSSVLCSAIMPTPTNSSQMPRVIHRVMKIAADVRVRSVGSSCSAGPCTKSRVWSITMMTITMPRSQSIESRRVRAADAARGAYAGAMVAMAAGSYSAARLSMLTAVRGPAGANRNTAP